jgi:hypothetical protein
MSDMFDHGDYFDPEDFEEGPRRQPKCKRCGAACTWHHTGERWRLMGTNGRLHRCSGDVPRSAAGFEPIKD